MKTTHWNWLRGFGRALHADLYHFLRNGSTWALIAIPGIFAALNVASAKLSWSHRQARLLAQAVEENREWTEPAMGNGFGPFVDGVTLGIGVGLFLLLIRTASLISQERDLGTIRWGLTQSVSRGQLAASKSMIAALCAISLLGSALIGSWITSSALFEFGAYEEDQFVIYEAHEIQSEVIRGVILAIPALLATGWFGLMVSSWARSNVQAISITLAGYLACDLFKSRLDGFQHFVFATFNPSIANESYLAEASKMAQGFSDYGWEPEVLELAWLVPCIQSLAFMALTFLALFRRRL